MAPASPITPGTPGFVRTPPGLARELVGALPPVAQAVLDPACGDGALLAAWLRGRRAPRAAGVRAHGIELDPGRLARARRRLAHWGAVAALEQGDALAPGRNWPTRTWVLANPPWVSFSGRQAHAGPRAKLCGGGWPSLHGAFLERIARHVAREGSGAALLLPASVAELPSYAPLRRTIGRWAQLAGPVRELGERAFPGVLGPALLVTLAPRPARSAGGGAPWTVVPEDARSLLTALARHPRLRPGTFADPGVHTGNQAGALVRPLEERAWPGLRRGRDLRPYALGPPSARLRTDLVPGEGRRFRVAALERYHAFPVLLRQTTSRIVAALHDEPTYFLNSLLAARALPDLDPAALVALLNGPVATAWHRASHRDARQRTFPQVKVGHLAHLPFPFARRADNPPLHDELARRVRALCPGQPGFERDVEALGRRTLAAYGLGRAEAALALTVAARPGG